MHKLSKTRHFDPMVFRAAQGWSIGNGVPKSQKNNRRTTGLRKTTTVMNWTITMLINFMFSVLLLMTLFAHLSVTLSTHYMECGWYNVFISQLIKYFRHCQLWHTIICEHKLKPTSVKYLDTINSKYSSFVHIDLDHSCYNADKPYSSFEWKGGVVIMYKKNLYTQCQKYLI